MQESVASRWRGSRKGSAMRDFDDMNKAERLALAAAVAPVLRSATEQTKRRRIGTLDKAGNPTGRYVDGAEALKGLARVQELEHAVDDGVRPSEAVCTNCGKMVKVAKGGAIPKVCQAGCDRRCPVGGCDRLVSASAARIASRAGRKAICQRCQRRKFTTALMIMSPEERRAIALKAQASQTPEQRSERGRKARGRETYEQRSAASRRGMTPEKKAALRRGREAQTPEQHAERARRGATTRMERYPKKGRGSQNKGTSCVRCGQTDRNYRGDCKPCKRQAERDRKLRPSG